MEKIKNKIFKFLHLDDIWTSLSGYVDTRISLVKIEVREEVGSALSRGLIIMTISMVGFLFILFLSFGVANYLNAVLESEFWGYMIIALFFGLLLAVLLAFRKRAFKMLGKQFAEMIKQQRQQ